MAAIRFSHVSKTYAGGHAAVRDLTLEIEDGEFLVLVGPSGCGKSTALRMIAGLEAITEGVLTIGGAVANHLSPRQRNVAMIFQSYALYPHLSVAENLGFALKVRKEPRELVERASAKRRRCSNSRRCSRAAPGSSPEDSASASRWDARSCVTPGRF